MALLAAVLIGAMGMTVGAAGLFKWNVRAAEVFAATQLLQDCLAMEPVVQEGAQSITIRLIQTAQDSNCFYALFDAIAEDGTLIDENNALDIHIDYHGAENPFCAMSWGFVDNLQQDTANSRYFEIFRTKATPDGSDLSMDVSFASLGRQRAKAGNDIPLVEGDWNFILLAHPTKQTILEVNETFTIAGCPAYVETVSLSPSPSLLPAKEKTLRHWKSHSA